MVRPSLLGDIRKRRCPSCSYPLTVWVEEVNGDRWEQFFDYYGEEPVIECPRCLRSLRELPR